MRVYIKKTTFDAFIHSLFGLRAPSKNSIFFSSVSCVQFQPQEINLSHLSDPPLDLKQPYVTFKVILEKDRWLLSLIPILSNCQTPV